MKRTHEDLQTALGQCFWIGLNGTDTSDPFTQEIFHTFQPGGTILFQRNVESLDQVRAFNRDLQALCRIPIFTSIDQEGGSVERLHKIIGTIPPAMALAASGNGEWTRELHGAHARILRDLGFNVNFTPVLDLALTGADNGLGSRCFSDDPEVVTRNARDVIAAHHAAGVFACGKHFPGLGDTDLDSHLDLPAVKRSWKRIEKEDLLPYRELLPELPFIMINHALYPEKNRIVPASLAPEIVSDLLIEKWKYKGLSISDDLVMGAVSNIHDLSNAARLALLAGNHMFLICRPEGVVKAYRDLLKAARASQELQSAIFQNAARILASKFQISQAPSRARISKDRRILKDVGEKVSLQSITLLRGRMPSRLPKEATAFLPRTKWITAEGTVLRRELGKAGCSIREVLYDLKISETEGQALASAAASTINIVVTAGIQNRPGQKALVEHLLQQGRRVALLHGAYPSPGVVPGVEVELAIYWTSPAALAAAAAVLTRQRKPSGKLPIESGDQVK